MSGPRLPQHATVDWPFKIRRAQATGVDRMLSGGGGGGEKKAVTLLVEGIPVLVGWCVMIIFERQVSVANACVLLSEGLSSPLP